MKNVQLYPELFQRYEGNPILTIKDWPYPANSIFNCAATKHNNETVLLARVEDRRGMSHLTVVRSKDGLSNWRIDMEPTILPDPENHPEEIWGIEDPRITYIGELDEYIIAYTSYSRGGPLVSLAKTKDFITFEKLGPVMPPEDKDAALFPTRFGGRWAMLHRPASALHGAGAHIWISFSPDLKHWGDHKIAIRAHEGGWWDANKIGLSPEPIRIPEGWLVLYHGVKTTGGGVIYRLGLALLDADNPAKLLRRSTEWIFGPQEHYEREGDVDDVVFPCGWIVEDSKIRLYYGGADTCIALATADLNKLRDYIMTCPPAVDNSVRWF
ncbi:MAG: glycosidase [Actinobacteria bacterium]|nr:glycosidase [Actinomycetota bacterium]